MLEEKRLKYLDYARGLAMLLVMYGHFYTVYDSSFRIWFYTFHIPLFFIITGILTYKKNSILNIKKSFKSLMIPYFVFGIINIIGLAILYYPNWTTDLISNIKKVTLLYGIKALWFLPCLFIATIIFHLIKGSFKEKNKLILIIFLISIIPFIDIDVNSIYGYKILCRALVATVFIFIGYFLGSKIDSIKVNVWKLLFLLITTLIFSKVLGKVDLYSLRLVDYFGYYISGIIGALLIILLFKHIEEKNIKLKLVDYIGKNTIIILGTHMLIGYFIKRIVDIISGTPIIVSNLYLNGFIMLIIVVIIEIFIINIINTIRSVGRYEKARKC